MDNKILDHVKKYTKLTSNNEVTKTKTIIYTLFSQNPRNKKMTIVRPYDNLHKEECLYTK